MCGNLLPISFLWIRILCSLLQPLKKANPTSPTALQKKGREGLNVTTEGPIRKKNKFTVLLSQSPELNVGRKLRVFMVVALHVLNNKYVGISIRYPISNMFLDLHVACCSGGYFFPELGYEISRDIQYPNLVVSIMMLL